MAALSDGWRRAGESVGLVPTMGALHEGHASLIRQARSECDRVVVSIFVNPRQFGPGEDFGRYPRTLDADRELAEVNGADVIFAPTPEVVYPPGFQTVVEVGPLTERLCGLDRPGHFDGVTTVVARLFGLVRPERAYFGQKDYQQAQVIRRMTEDLALPVTVVVCPIVRDTDGLALSSRNRYLSEAERKRARAVPESLARVAARFVAGDTDADRALAEMGAWLGAAGVGVDYVAACDPDTLTPVKELSEGVVMLVAARIGGTRLIDNTILPEAPPSGG